MLRVLFKCLGIDENIVEIHNDEFVKPVVEESIHGGLESGGSVGESKRHDNEFVCAITRSEGGLVFVADFDGNLVVTSEEIKLCEEFCMCEAVMEVINAW